MIKKLLSIAAVVAMPLFAANAQESVAKVVFEEDFSLLTTGEVGAPDTETAILNEDGTIKSEYVHKAGWTISAAQSAGGSIRFDKTIYLTAPVLDLSATVDGEITVEFDVYAENTAGRGAEFVYIKQIMGSSSNEISHMFYAETWTHVTFSSNKDKSDEPNKNFATIPSNGVIQLALKSVWNSIYIKNFKVIINVDPNAGGGEAKDFTGKYSFTSTKEITSPLEGDTWATYPQAEFDFTITKNEGDDADVYPYLINEFPALIPASGNKYATNPLKAKPTADGTSLEMGIGHANKVYGTQDHEDIEGPNGKDDTATTLTISPIADSENYTIVDGFQIVKHVDLGFYSEKRNLCKFTDIVITRTGDVDAIDTIVVDEKAVTAPEGVFTINGAKIRNTNDASDLQPGFYIIGGKKVVIR